MKHQPKYDTGQHVIVDGKHLPDNPKQALETTIRKKIFLKQDKLTREGWYYWIGEGRLDMIMLHEDNIKPNERILVRKVLIRYDKKKITLTGLKEELKTIAVDMVGLSGIEGELVLKYFFEGCPKELKLKDGK